MKTKFRKHEINYGCYELEQFTQLWPKTRSVTILQILESPLIPIKDKRWFVWNNCNLTLDQKKKLALKLAWIVLPIYEVKYPNDFRVKECLKATEDFYAGKISRDILTEKRDAAYAAADAADADAEADADADADAAADAAYAADAAAADAADDADAAADAAYAADAAARAAAAFKTQTYSQLIQQTLIDFVKK